MTSDERLLQILEESRCLSKGQLLDYLGNSLYPEELRAVELHLASCELCSTALEGFEKVQNPGGLLQSITPPVLPKIAPIETIKVKEEKTQAIPATNIRKLEVPHSKSNNKGFLKKFIGAALIIIIGGGLIWWFELRDDHYPFAREMKRNLDENNENESFTMVQPSTEAFPENQQNLKDEEAKKGAETPIPPQEPLHTGTVVAPVKTAEKVEDIKPKTAKANNVAIGPQEINPTIKENISNNKAAKEEKAVAAAAIPKKEEKEVEKIVSKAEQPKDKADAEKTNSEKASSAKKEEPKSSNASSDYEIGVALFKKKQFGSALVYLNSVESDKNNPHYWDALYYAAVCNKNLNNKSKAKKQLKQIIKAGVAQKSAAEQQLADLDSKEE